MKNPLYIGLNKISRIYYDIITKLYIKNATAILDIGCGTRPQQFIKPTIHCCVDPYKPYLEKINKTTDRIWIMINGDWSYAINDSMIKSEIDSVFLLDVIEHLDKEESIKLLKETEKLVREQIIIYTPMGFFEQKETPDGKDAWGMNGTEFQKHKSGWYPSDFGEGWTVWVIPYAHIVDSLNQSIKPSSAILAIYNK